MAYSFDKEDVNKKHTLTWTKVNDDARRNHFRAEFLKKFGGEFIEGNAGLVTWKPHVAEEKPPVAKEIRTICLINPDGEVVEVQNFTKYCRDNDLSRSAMYEVLRGKRKQHKGFKAKENNK
tara:strand:- start:2161 stop:2523 length:363 start_codon:yes stop_codon:yes gene_type:complete